MENMRNSEVLFVAPTNITDESLDLDRWHCFLPAGHIFALNRGSSMSNKLWILGLIGFLMIAGSAQLSNYMHQDRVIIKAVLDGNSAEARRLLENGVDVNIRANNGTTALMAAASRGDMELVKLLIDYGADVNATCDRGATALIDAVHKDHKDVVRTLLASKADPNIKDGSKATALSVATQNKNQDIIDMLREHGATVTPAQ